MSAPLPDISDYQNKVEIIQETAEQIIKDFGIFGLQLTFEGKAENAYQQLFEQILPHITTLAKTNKQKLMGIIYRIDISDRQLKNALENATHSTFEETITHLILKRELQKVVIRHHFKNATDAKK